MGAAMALVMLLGRLVEAHNPIVPDRQALIVEAASLLRRHALAASSVDWPAATEAARQIADRSGRRADLDEALTHLVNRLGDGHSMYIPSQEAARLQGQPEPANADTALGRHRGQRNGVAVLELGGFLGMNPIAVAAAAEHLRSQLRAASEATHCGLILDLANNTGGNMWPMLQGLAPMLPSGPVAYFESIDGLRTPIRTAGPSDVRAPGQSEDAPPALPLARVAVVVGEATGSSGEIVAIAMKALPQVRFFGQPTAGVSTGNVVLPLPNGALLAIASVRTVDRLGRVQVGRLVPDELMPTAGGGAVEAASRWVAAACAKPPVPS
jgi:C-terminal processing protease CtpA/Prc